MDRSIRLSSGLGISRPCIRSATLAAMFVLCSCIGLLLLAAGTRAASRHAAKPGASVAAGPGRSGRRLPTRPQASHAHVRRWHEFRRTATSRTAVQWRRSTDQRLVKQERRQGHPPPAYPAPRITDRYLSSLPHRTQQTPERSLPRPVPRQILVLIDQEQPTSLGPELARTYGLERISSEPVPLLGARAELMHVRQGRSQEGTLAALQRDPRVRSAQPNHRYLHTGA